MGGTGELGLYGYLGTSQSRPGRGLVTWIALGCDVPTGSGFPTEAKYPSTAGSPLPTEYMPLRENGRPAMR